MMKIDECPYGREEWTAITAGLPGLSLMQTWEYGEAKAAGGSWSAMRALVRDAGERPVAAFQGAVRKLPVVGGGLIWINRGPLMIDPAAAVDEVLAAIATWAARRHWYVRLALPLPEMEPGEHARFRPTGATGWCSSLVDLTQTAEQRRSALDQKWRNCLNKAVRSEVQVEAAADDATLGAYAGELERRLAERPFATTVTPGFLNAIQALLPVERKLVVFTAKKGADILGYHVAAVYGSTAEYVSGLLNEEGRRLNAGHALLWDAMETMAARGVRRYDLGGMHPELTPRGIFHFKEGAGGTFYRLPNELETIGRDWRSAVIRRKVEAARKAEAVPGA